MTNKYKLRIKKNNNNNNNKQKIQEIIGKMKI